MLVNPASEGGSSITPASIFLPTSLSPQLLPLLCPSSGGNLAGSGLNLTENAPIASFLAASGLSESESAHVISQLTGTGSEPPTSSDFAREIGRTLAARIPLTPESFAKCIVSLRPISCIGPYREMIDSDTRLACGLDTISHRFQLWGQLTSSSFEVEFNLFFEYQDKHGFRPLGSVKSLFKHSAFMDELLKVYLSPEGFRGYCLEVNIPKIMEAGITSEAFTLQDAPPDFESRFFRAIGRVLTMLSEAKQRTHSP